MEDEYLEWTTCQRYSTCVPEICVSVWACKAIRELIHSDRRCPVAEAECVKHDLNTSASRLSCTGSSVTLCVTPLSPSLNSDLSVKHLNSHCPPSTAQMTPPCRILHFISRAQVVLEYLRSFLLNNMGKIRYTLVDSIFPYIKIYLEFFTTYSSLFLNKHNKYWNQWIAILMLVFWNHTASLWFKI